MLLREIFDLLAFGEVAHTSIGGDAENETIPESKYLQIVPAINAALDALHSRFELRFNNVLVQQKEGIDTYTIDSKNNDDYLISAENKLYVNDLIRIDRIMDSCGESVYINNERERSSVVLPTYNSIEFPTVVDGDIYNVIYHAKHPKILSTGSDVLDQTVDLPADFLDAFLAYIGYRVYKNRKSLTSESPSNNYYSIYQAECARLEGKNPINTHASNDIVRDAGWV